MEKASFCKSRNLQCFQDPLRVFRQDSLEFLVKSLRAQFMQSIQGNVSSKQDIVFHIKEANRSQSINVIIHSGKGKWHLLSLPSQGEKKTLSLWDPTRIQKWCFCFSEKCIYFSHPQQVSPRVSSMTQIALMGQGRAGACCF